MFFLCYCSSAGAAASKVVEKDTIFHLSVREMISCCCSWTYGTQAESMSFNDPFLLTLSFINMKPNVCFTFILMPSMRAECLFCCYASRDLSHTPHKSISTSLHLKQKEEKPKQWWESDRSIHTTLKCKANTMWFMQPWPLKHVFCLLLLFMLHPVLPSPCYFHRKWNRHS